MPLEFPLLTSEAKLSAAAPVQLAAFLSGLQGLAASMLLRTAAKRATQQLASTVLSERCPSANLTWWQSEGQAVKSLVLQCLKVEPFL